MAFNMDMTKVLQYMTNTFSSTSLFVWLIFGICASGLLIATLISIAKRVGGGNS